MPFQGRIVIVGGTGVVGGEMLHLLSELDCPGEQVSVYATERSAGSEVEYGEETLEVEAFADDAFRQASAVLLATPADVSRTLAQKAQAAGAWVVDASGAFRADPEVPLAVPGVRVTPPARGRVIACASPLAAAVFAIIEGLRAQGVASATVTALFGAGAAGAAGVSELERETVDLMSGREPEPKIFPHRLAFNAIPQVGELTEEGWSAEEASWAAQLLRLSPGGPPVTGTAVQVPGFFGHLACFDLELKVPTDVVQLRESLGQAPGIKVLDAPADKIYPMPMLVSAERDVHVGRLRGVPGRPSHVLLVAAFEGGRRTAAAAVDAVESLMGPVH